MKRFHGPGTSNTSLCLFFTLPTVTGTVVFTVLALLALSMSRSTRLKWPRLIFSSVPAGSRPDRGDSCSSVAAP